MTSSRQAGDDIVVSFGDPLRLPPRVQTWPLVSDLVCGAAAAEHNATVLQDDRDLDLTVRFTGQANRWIVLTGPRIR